MAASVLSKEFVEALNGLPNPVPAHLKLLNINTCAHLSLDGYTGPLLDADQLARISLTLPVTQQRLGLKTSLLQALSSAINADKYLQVDVKTPSGYVIDVAMVTNNLGQPQPIADYQDFVSKPLPAGYHRVAIKLLDYTDLTLGNVRPTGFNALGMRSLRSAGYTVVSVSHQEFGASVPAVKRVQFIQTRLREALRGGPTMGQQTTGAKLCDWPGDKYNQRMSDAERNNAMTVDKNDARESFAAEMEEKKKKKRKKRSKEATLNADKMPDEMGGNVAVKTEETPLELNQLDETQSGAAVQKDADSSVISDKTKATLNATNTDDQAKISQFDENLERNGNRITSTISGKDTLYRSSHQMAGKFSQQSDFKRKKYRQNEWVSPDRFKQQLSISVRDIFATDQNYDDEGDSTSMRNATERKNVCEVNARDCSSDGNSTSEAARKSDEEYDKKSDANERISKREGSQKKMPKRILSKTRWIKSVSQKNEDYKQVKDDLIAAHQTIVEKTIDRVEIVTNSGGGGVDEILKGNEKSEKRREDVGGKVDQSQKTGSGYK
jgi:hypothetical protein